MDHETKGAAVDSHVRGLRGHVRELVNDIIYGTVSLPIGWRAPGDATVLALDPQAALSSDQEARLKVLLDQSVQLFVMVDQLTDGYVRDQRAAGVPLAKNDLDSLRRGRGPNRLRDMIFELSPGWPERITDEMRLGASAVLERSLSQRRRHLAGPQRNLAEVRDTVGPLLPDVRRHVLDWAAEKGLSASIADAVVSEVVDQLVRTMLARDEAPLDLAAWVRVTARFKLTSAAVWRADVAQQREVDTGPDVVGEQAAQHVDMMRRLDRITRVLRERATWFHNRTPPRRFDALAHDVAADVVGTGNLVLLEAVVRGTPEGVDQIRVLIARRGHVLSTDREQAVLRLLRDTLERLLRAQE